MNIGVMQVLKEYRDAKGRWCVEMEVCSSFDNNGAIRLRTRDMDKDTSRLMSLAWASKVLAPYIQEQEVH